MRTPIRFSFLLLVVVTSACQPVTGGPGSGGSIPSCSPSHVRENEFGRIAAQQSGPQQPVVWGVYPKKLGDQYVVSKATELPTTRIDDY